MIKLKTSIPGPNSVKVLSGLRRKNGGYGGYHPFVFSGKGEGAYCEDIDGNRFLDFASQIASNPLGYNHPAMLEVVKKYSSRFPVKYAGQDFAVKEHLDLLEEITKISPMGMDAAFLVNSGAEAVENAIKISMRQRTKKKFSVSLHGAFHGRTLGALSQHHSNPIHRKGYTLLENRPLTYGDTAVDEFKEIINKEGADAISFLIIEHMQGEGGYRIASEKMVRDLRKLTKKNGIPYIADEVQSGMGRSGKWWMFEHYGIAPDAFSSAKALQVGAVVSSKKMFPNEAGAISSTWGGGHVLDMALGLETIRVIKKDKLLERNRIIGMNIVKSLSSINGTTNVRGRGLLIAFDLADSTTRTNFIAECAKRGLLVLPCGQQGVRIIPPYVVQKEEVDEGMAIIEQSLKEISKKSYKADKKICGFLGC